MTILVVDDEPTVPRLFDQRFRKEIREGRYHFLYAASGEEALVRLNSYPDVALILSDINMPGMSGLDLLDALKARRWIRPVYMVSAYDGSEYERQALEKGALGFLAKPIRFGELGALFASLETRT